VLGRNVALSNHEKTLLACDLTRHICAEFPQDITIARERACSLRRAH